MVRRNKGRGSTKKKRGGKSKQKSTETKNNDGAPDDSTTTTLAPTSVKVSEEEERPNVRFNIGDRVECHMDDKSVQPGYIIMRNCQRDDGVLCPYVVRLDKGVAIYAPFDKDTCIRKSLDTTNLRYYKIGTRVEYRPTAHCIKSSKMKYDEWVSGTVLSCELDWVEADPLGGAPYSIRFDGEDSSLYIWGPRDSIREIQADANVNDVKTLRFDVGDRVESKFGFDAWQPGTIIKTHYKESSFETGFTAPYQIQLDIGNRIYAPLDEDKFIRKVDTPKPYCLICFEDEQITEGNPLVRECACRGTNGYIHTQCLTKLAITRAANTKNYQEGIDDQNPFIQCITCKQEFKKGSWSFSSLACGLCSVFGGDDKIGGPWNGVATSMFAHSMMTECKDKAEAFLTKRCNMITDLQSRTSQLDLDLSRFLGDLAVVYEERGELDRMKEVLDQSLSLIVALEKGSHSRRKINILSSLATHAYLVGNMNDALERYEECINLTRGQEITNDVLLASLLIKCGNLELQLGNIEWGIEHMSESVDIMTIVYGRDHDVVSKLAGCLDRIREGTMEMIPKALIRLDFSSW
jgi:hypothetical protein